MAVDVRMWLIVISIFLIMSIVQFALWRGMSVAWLFTTEAIRLTVAIFMGYWINKWATG